MKRIFDFTLSLVALIILSPLLIPLAIILKLTGEHYIFYHNCPNKLEKAEKFKRLYL